MQPGRELDALVAEKVMGITREQMDRYKNLPSYAASYDGAVEEPRRYSTDITSAWSVVEKLQSSNPYWDETGKEAFLAFQMSPAWGVEGACWMVNFGDSTTLEFGKTAPHAICLAALKAVGA